MSYMIVAVDVYKVCDNLLSNSVTEELNVTIVVFVGAPTLIKNRKK